MGKEEKCNLCNELVKIKYIPMDEWKINVLLRIVSVLNL